MPNIEYRGHVTLPVVPATANDLTQYNDLADALKSCDYDAQVWHSGGGIFGVLVTLKTGGDVFFGDAEGDSKWGYDYTDANENYIRSGYMGNSKYSACEWASDVIDNVLSGHVTLPVEPNTEVACDCQGECNRDCPCMNVDCIDDDCGGSRGCLQGTCQCAGNGECD